MFRHRLHFNGVTQVWLIRAVFAHSVRIGDARKGFCNALAAGKSLKHVADHWLHGGQHIFLLHKAHFHIQLIELTRQAVSTRVFIAETRRNLKIAVKARHHQELLILLRRLRQSIKLAGVNTRWHQKVPRALWRGSCENGGLKLVKAQSRHALAHICHHFGAGDNVVMQTLAAQIQKAIFKAGFFRIILIAKHWQRQFACF